MSGSSFLRGCVDIGAYGFEQGMCLYVRQGLVRWCSRVCRTRYCMCVRLDVPGKQRVFLAAVYVPPRGSVEWQGGDGYTQAYAQLCDFVLEWQRTGQVLLMGDFNAHTQQVPVAVVAQADEVAGVQAWRVPGADLVPRQRVSEDVRCVPWAGCLCSFATRRAASF